MKRLLFLLLSILLLAGQGWGATYYVNGSGSEYTGAQGIYAIGNDTAGSGSLAAPWATLNKAVSSGSATDTVYVAAGTYTQEWVDSKGLNWIADGTVTVVAASTRVFYGTGGVISVNGFTLNGGGTADVGFDIASGATSFASINNNVSALNTNGFVYKLTKDCTINGGVVTNDNVLAAIITKSGSSVLTLTASNMTVTANSSRFYLGNDAAGPATFINNNVDLTLSGAGYMFNIYATGNDTISGGTYTLRGSPNSFIRLANGTGTGALTTTGTVNVNIVTATGNQVVNITAGSHPVDLSGLNITTSSASQTQTIIYVSNQPTPKIHGNIINTTSTALSCVHIQVVSVGATVGASETYNNLSYTKSVTGSVYIVGSDTPSTGDNKHAGAKIYNNTIYGPLYYDRTITTNGLHGIEYAWSQPGHIYNNYVNGTAYGLVLKGGGHDWEGIGGAYHNLIVNIGGTTTAAAVGSIIVKGATNVNVFNNVIYLADGYLSKYGLLHVYENFDDSINHYPAGAIVKNNIFVADADMYAIEVNNDSSSITADNNLFYHYGGAFKSVVGTTAYTDFADWVSAGYDANGKFANPKFRSTTDFRLQPSSPCINEGAPVGLTTDFAGKSISGTPDIGAYEYYGTRGGGGFGNLNFGFGW